MSTGADVVIQVMPTANAMQLMRQLTEKAIQRALRRTKTQIIALQKKYTPRRTGKLQDSFDIGLTPRSIVMKWDAVDDGFHYAEVVDTGRSGYKPFTGRFYSEGMKNEAHVIFIEELLSELSTIGSVP